MTMVCVKRRSTVFFVFVAFECLQVTGVGGGGGYKRQFKVSRAHNLERATSMYSCHGVFTDQFIFRAVLARI